jgi:hypothetical protein
VPASDLEYSPGDDVSSDADRDSGLYSSDDETEGVRMPSPGLADVFQGLYFCLDQQYLVPAVVKLVTGNMRGRVLGSHKRAMMPIKAPGAVAGGDGQVYVMKSAGVRHAVSFFGH